MRIIIKKLFFLIFAFFSIVIFLSCKTMSPVQEKNIKSINEASIEYLIPIPASIIPTGNRFKLSKTSKIYFDQSSDENESISIYLKNNVNSITGFELSVLPLEKILQKGNIYLLLQDGINSLGKEGYELNISEHSIEIKANSPEGLFRGVQTLVQMLFPLKGNINESSNEIYFPTVQIKDFPRFCWRGVMLDVARHFFSVNDVKKLIDLISLYKFNHLHLHLTDDQGWRIEIKSWPKLTEIGGSTQVGGGNGGFYTHKEYLEIVEYAKKRYITIVPEIDMPGHTNAALASYPELNCDGKATELYTGIKVGFSSLCLDKELTYTFIEDVINELSAITPGEYIHIGGDEAYATDSNKYINFIERVQRIVESNNKKMIGWEEIAQAKLTQNSIIQFWRESDYVKLGLKQGNKIIFSPASKVYMDMKYNPETFLGLNWAGYIEISDSYNWDPLDLITDVNEESILGIEAPLWTETILNFSDIEFMLFPRLPAVSEIGWSIKNRRNWEYFKVRLSNQGKYWDKIGLNFYRSNQINW